MLQRTRQNAQALYAAAPTSAVAAQLALANARAVELPQTATLAERNILFGLILMLFAALTMALGKTWHRLGRKVQRAEQHQRQSDFRKLP